MSRLLLFVYKHPEFGFITAGISGVLSFLKDLTTIGQFVAAMFAVMAAYLTWRTKRIKKRKAEKED